jgi:hypothetical protein
MSTTPPTEQLLPAELRALYDIRIKEMHHYNTMIWAFPLAYATLLAAEFRFVDEGSWPLVFAAIFNCTLWYVFWHHLQNKRCIKTTLIFTEGKLAALYGSDFTPNFPKEGSSCLPTATTVMSWSIGVVSVLFGLRAVLAMVHCDKI